MVILCFFFALYVDTTMYKCKSILSAPFQLKDLGAVSFLEKPTQQSVSNLTVICVSAFFEYVILSQEFWRGYVM